MTQLLTPEKEIDISRVPSALTERRFVARERYYERTFVELEKQRFWPRVCGRWPAGSVDPRDR
jgi:hypothetical protein